MDKEDKIVLGIWFVFIALVFTAMYCSEAQTPDPDTPFLPYWEYHKTDVEPDIESELIEQTEGEKCQEVIEVWEHSNVKVFCWVAPNKIKNPDGIVKYLFLPAGCVGLVLSLNRYNIDVYQNRECDIVLWNRGGNIEKKPKTGV